MTFDNCIGLQISYFMTQVFRLMQCRFDKQTREKPLFIKRQLQRTHSLVNLDYLRSFLSTITSSYYEEWKLQLWPISLPLQQNQSCQYNQWYLEAYFPKCFAKFLLSLALSFLLITTILCFFFIITFTLLKGLNPLIICKVFSKKKEIWISKVVNTELWSS